MYNNETNKNNTILSKNQQIFNNIIKLLLPPKTSITLNKTISIIRLTTKTKKNYIVK